MFPPGNQVATPGDANYTVLIGDEAVIAAPATARTITLYTAKGNRADAIYQRQQNPGSVGGEVWIVNIGTAPLTIAPNGSDTIYANTTLYPNQALRLRSDGVSKWYCTFSGGGSIVGTVGTAGAATVAVSGFGDGRQNLTVLTLTAFVVGAPGAAAAAKGIGNKVFTFPAGVHAHRTTYFSLGLTAAGTNKTPKTGIGSVVATGAVSVLNGTATFMDYVTEQTATDTAGTAFAAGPLGATAGVLSGISLNKAADVKDMFLNAAATWSADNTGNLTATGTIAFDWVKLA